MYAKARPHDGLALRPVANLEFIRVLLQGQEDM
jgi:hypothetical protein